MDPRMNLMVAALARENVFRLIYGVKYATMAEARSRTLSLSFSPRNIRFGLSTFKGKACLAFMTRINRRKGRSWSISWILAAAMVLPSRLYLRSYRRDDRRRSFQVPGPLYLYAVRIFNIVCGDKSPQITM